MNKSRIKRNYQEPAIPFTLKAPFKPMGDQPKAIHTLVDGLNDGHWAQVLVGATGTGKTFTMANIIERVNRPTLVLAHNKTLAAQLCSEFREFFPENAVEYFVSYYDYYQPEAYVPTTDTYIEKDSAINDEIDKLRHSATAALSERRDVIIVASVSCIYSIGDPIDYRNMVISLRTGMEWSRDALIEKLVAIQYERNDINFVRNKCGATRWRSFLPAAAAPLCGWNFLETRLTGSARLTRLPARSRVCCPTPVCTRPPTM